MRSSMYRQVGETPAPAPLSLMVGVVRLLLAVAGCWLGGAPPALAQPNPADTVDAPREQVILAEDVMFDEAGVPIVDGLPGVRATRQVPDTVKEALAPLAAERDRVLSGAREARAGGVQLGLPPSAEGPPAMDSGDPDPDRLRPDARPPRPTF